MRSHYTRVFLLKNLANGETICASSGLIQTNSTAESSAGMDSILKIPDPLESKEERHP